MKRNRVTLKSYFEKGDIPTQENFADLIDSMLNQEDDNIGKEPNDPMRVTAAGAEEGLINFYRADTGGPILTWQIKQKPGGRPGFSIGDSTTTRLFIDGSTGYVGIGVAQPKAQLHISDYVSVGPLTVGPAQGRLEVSGSSAEFVFMRRNLTTWPASPAAGDRFVWYNKDGSSALLYTEGKGDIFAITNSGSVGIGTTDPNAKLHIINAAQNANGDTLILGPTNTSNLRLGYHTDYSWIQSHGSKPLAINPLGNNVGIGTATPTGKLDVAGDIRAGNSDIYFTKTDHNHTGIGNAEGFAAIENAQNYEALMILGRTKITVTKNKLGTTTTTSQRRVRLWDYLEVNGDQDITGNLNTGTLKTSVFLLGDKWRFSAVGDHYANDEWIRMDNISRTDYYGGFAASKLWTTAGQIGSSDLRLKTEVNDLKNVLDNLITLRGVRFKWLHDQSNASYHMGLIAQEVEKVFPEVVEIGPDGMKGINYPALIAPLIEAIKQQQTQINELKNEMLTLKAS